MTLTTKNYKEKKENFKKVDNEIDTLINGWDGTFESDFENYLDIVMETEGYYRKQKLYVIAIQEIAAELSHMIEKRYIKINNKTYDLESLQLLLDRLMELKVPSETDEKAADLVEKLLNSLE